MNRRNSLPHSLWLLVATLPLISVCTAPVSAAPLAIEQLDVAISLEILQDLPLATPLRLRVNVIKGGQTYDVDFSFTSGATNVSAESIAAMLAAAINAKAGANTVTVTGAKLSFTDGAHWGIKSADTDRGYLGGWVTLAQVFPDETPLLFSVGPDPNTGSFVTATPGTLFLTGPNALNASLAIATGTSGLDVATLFATTLISAGYEVNAFGADTFFGLPSPGTFTIRVDGTGLEYSLSEAAAIPEPSSLLLLGTGTAALLILATASTRRRRKLKV